jgi:hypothetical protein
MTAITDGKWIADLGAMTCRNIESRVVVGFHKRGNTFEGKLRDMPTGLLEKWAALVECGEKHIRQAVEEAEVVFLRAWFEAGIKNCMAIKKHK